MIGSVKGEVIWCDSDEICVGDTNGNVGYVTKVSSETKKWLPVGTQDVTLFVYHYVREDTNVLYGFLSLEQRRLFKALIGVSGVGPSLALGILGTFTPPQLASIVAEGDVDALCAVPGVGKKTGARLLMDLKSKVSVEDYPAAETPGSDTQEADPAGVSVSGHKKRLSDNNQSVALAHKNDVRSAMMSLGYNSKEIEAVLLSAPPFVTSDELLRWALTQISTSGGVQ